MPWISRWRWGWTNGLRRAACRPAWALGGSFVENDIASLTALAQRKGVELRMLAAARAVSQQQAERTMRKIAEVMPTLRDKRVGLLGLAVKPHTSSVAGSSSVALARQLAENGAVVRAYDPFAMIQAERELEQVVSFCDSAYMAAEGVDALILATGWPEFRSLDFAQDEDIAAPSVDCGYEKPARLRAAARPGI